MFAALLDSAPQPEILAEQHDQRDHLYAAIRSLPTRFRQIVWLRYAEELTFQEIGQRLQMPANKEENAYATQSSWYPSCHGDRK
ncbi:hypothetical protein KDAU_51780 [Dictyobacter aurantiacus]|uniref:RNA polymerase sigma-70 region 4 domain-containing protein n=2 Tax=Dictyobacter aurantiacus TaxID=1936993 RepID=A0A401ZLT7_9CHLR|nr:hypothetical protein KDAU_51780 [Dictyobacter aurantiacus]